MVDLEIFEQLLPAAHEWAKAQEELILQRGFPLNDRQMPDAITAGVRDPARIRVLVADRVPVPDDPALAGLSRLSPMITNASRGIAFGYGVVIRTNCWGDRELLVHQFVHVGQCERSGGIEQFVSRYLSDRRSCPDFSSGQVEEEARRRAREICATPLA